MTPSKTSTTSQRKKDTLPDISVSVIVPALNEENNIEGAINNIIEAFEEFDLDWEIVIVNDGSTDGTGARADKFAASNPRIKVLHHTHPMGIGRAFLDGVKSASKFAVTWLPGDGENDAREILKYVPLIQHVDVVVPFVINTGVRSLFRRLLSTTYLWIINLSFGTNFNYTNGTVIYRRHIFERIAPRADSFFFQAECLITAIRAGMIFAEVPVSLQQRTSGKSKAVSLRSLFRVIRDFIRLFIAVHILHTAGRVPAWMRDGAENEAD
jgi:glycosyltransferase involved in cell wall biosynthesis